MTKETPVKTEAVNLCRRFPTLPARTLARMLHRDHPQLYTTIESARTTVRGIMGLAGPSNARKAVADIVRPKHAQTPHAYCACSGAVAIVICHDAKALVGGNSICQ